MELAHLQSGNLPDVRPFQMPIFLVSQMSKGIVGPMLRCDLTIVGNAVPPLFARRIFENIIKKLQDTDGFI